MAAPVRAGGGYGRRALAAVLLVLAGVLAPVGALPGPEGAGDAVQAQSAVLVGTADPCPTDPPGFAPGGPNDSECHLETPACPASPVTAAVMNPSVDDTANPAISEVFPVGGTPTPVPLYRYPDFCEERILAPVAAAHYTACTTTTGFIVMTHVMAQQTDPAGTPMVDSTGAPLLDPGGVPGLDSGGNPVTVNMCRLLTPAQCASGLYRVDSNVCRGVTRRTWTCPAGTLHRNEFNTCYRPQATPSGTANPACGPGAPNLMALDCEDYVGEDYARSPASLACSSDFDTGSAATALSANTLPGTAARHWCEFNAAFLDAACHALAPPAGACARTTARCLKRASRTGGCDAVAAVIRCRAEQAKFSAGTRTAEEVQEAGCRPCVVLPFSPPSSSCPDEYREEPDRPRAAGNGPLFDAVHRFQRGFAWSDGDCSNVRAGGDLASYPMCRDKPFCDGVAPQGRLEWSSGHGSGLAIVNLPVVLRLEGLPQAFQDRALVLASSLYHDAFTRKYRAFDNDVHGDAVIRVWPRVDPSASYGQVTEYAGRTSGTCLLAGTPEYRLVITELRPDVPNQRAEIERLFGSSALDWWTSLGEAEQRRHTERLGLTFWDDITPNPGETQESAETRELTDRSAKLSAEVPCNYGAVVWCRWTPSRAGYFTATAAGAWRVEQVRQTRQWQADPPRGYRPLDGIDTYLRNNAQATAFERKLRRVGLTLADAGLIRDAAGAKVDRDLLLETTPKGVRRWDDDEWLYSDNAAPSFRCPASDLRVQDCAGSHDYANYTTADPVGIQVHEIRVAARTPRS